MIRLLEKSPHVNPDVNFQTTKTYRVPFFALSTEDARVVESVDTQDLKSCGHCGRAGSIPASSTTKSGGYRNVTSFFYVQKRGIFQ